MWWSNLFAGMSPANFFNFSFLPKYLSFFVQGLEYTLLLSIISVGLAVIPALALALMRLSRNKIVRNLSGAYIAVFRSTPMMVQLYIIFYGLFSVIKIPSVVILGFIDLSRFIPGVVALALNSSAYVAEIIRAGIQAVDKGQMEAARSLGFHHKHEARCAAAGDQEHSPRARQRARHDGEGIVHLLGARHDGAHLGREDRCDDDVQDALAVRSRSARVLRHQLPGRQGHRSDRKENAPWRQDLNSSALRT